MYIKFNFFVCALALMGVSGAMACECGVNGTAIRGNDATTDVVGQSENVGTQRFPAVDTSYSRNYESSGIKRASAEDRSYPRRSVNSLDSSPTRTYGNGVGRGRKEN